MLPSEPVFCIFLAPTPNQCSCFVLNVRSCYLKRWFCKYFNSTSDLVGPVQFFKLNWIIQKNHFVTISPPTPEKNLGHKKFKCPDSGLQRQQQSQNLN